MVADPILTVASISSYLCLIALSDSPSLIVQGCEEVKGDGVLMLLSHTK